MADDNTIRITVLRDKTFRGRLHFMELDYDVSSGLAALAVEQGVAKWNLAQATPVQLNNWYEHVVGYRPQVDDPTMSDDDLRALCLERLAAETEQ